MSLEESVILRNPAVKPSDPLSEGPQGNPTIFQAFKRSVEANKDRPCLGRRFLKKLHYKDIIENGVPKKMELPELTPASYKSYSEVHQIVERASTNLKAFTKLEAKSRIGIYLETCMAWQVLAQANFRNGVILVTCYANLGEESLVHVVNECELDAIIVGSKNVRILESLKDQMPTLKRLVIVRDLTDEKPLGTKAFEWISYDDITKPTEGEIIPEEEVSNNDVAVIMYTSGSTGVPKGVLVSHRQLLASAASVGSMILLNRDDVLIGYLPLAHIFELAAETAFLLVGGCIGYGTPRTLTAKGVGPETDESRKGDVEMIAPTKMAGVPRVYLTIMKGALEQVEQSGFLKRWLFQTAFSRKKTALGNGSDTPFWNWLVFRKLREKLGGRLIMMISGGAPLGSDVQEFLHAVFCCKVLQGYGLTETCAGGSIQSPNDPLTLNNIGYPVASNEMKLVSVPDLGYSATANPPKGEIWIRGVNVTFGYYKQEDKTKEAWTDDGWFRTGDIGVFNPDGTVSIIDRLKNLVKLAHGEYVALEHLEMIYGGSPFIAPGAICVYADSLHDHCVAVAVPQDSYVNLWASQNNVNLPRDEILKLPQFNKAVLESLESIAVRFKKRRFEHVAAIRLVSDVWGPENQLTTASLKVIRSNIAKKYADIIDELYASLERRH